MVGYACMYALYTLKFFIYLGPTLPIWHIGNKITGGKTGFGHQNFVIKIFGDKFRH